MKTFNLFGAACEVVCPECNGERTVYVPPASGKVKTAGGAILCDCCTGDYNTPFYGAKRNCPVCLGIGQPQARSRGGCGTCKQRGFVLTDFGKEVLDFMVRHLAQVPASPHLERKR